MPLKQSDQLRARSVTSHDTDERKNKGAGRLITQSLLKKEL